MTIATRPHTDPATELEDEVRHVRNLVTLRDLLARRGATPAELQECAAAIGEARTRLAETARLVSTRYAEAA